MRLYFLTRIWMSFDLEDKHWSSAAALCLVLPMHLKQETLSEMWQNLEVNNILRVCLTVFNWLYFEIKLYLLVLFCYSIHLLETGIGYFIWTRLLAGMYPTRRFPGTHRHVPDPRVPRYSSKPSLVTKIFPKEIIRCQNYSYLIKLSFKPICYLQCNYQQIFCPKSSAQSLQTKSSIDWELKICQMQLYPKNANLGLWGGYKLRIKCINFAVKVKSLYWSFIFVRLHTFQVRTWPHWSFLSTFILLT